MSPTQLLGIVLIAIGFGSVVLAFKGYFEAVKFCMSAFAVAFILYVGLALLIGGK